MAQPETPDFDNIPLFVPEQNRFYGWRPEFQSPDDGPIVELFPGVFHADPITQEMLDEGRWLIFSDFRNAAEPAGVSIQAASRGFSHVFYRQMNLASEQLKSDHPPGSRVLMGHPYSAYGKWGGGENSFRRSQILLGSQTVWDAYTEIRDSGAPNEKRYKFLKVIEAIFELEEPPFEEPTAPDDEDYDL